MPWVLVLASFFHAWLIYFNVLIFSFFLLILLTYFFLIYLFYLFFSHLAEYDKEQEWIMEIVATCKQNIKNKIELLVTFFSPLIPENSCEEPVTAHILFA